MIHLNKSRRLFLQKGAAGLAGLAMTPFPFRANNISHAFASDKKTNFIYRTLGKTGHIVPVISMGSAFNPNMVLHALDKGIKYFFTAAAYQNGNHERIIAKALKDRPRDSFIISTALFTPPLVEPRTKNFRKGLPSDLLEKELEGSFERLGMDYIDIYYIAGVASQEAVTYEPFLKTLYKFKKQGKIRFLGITTHQNEPDVIRATVDCKAYDLVATAYNFRQPHKREVEEAMAYAAQSGLGIIGMKTQAGVFWDEERKYPINNKAAIKWAIQNKNIHTIISGFANTEQMNVNLEAMEDPVLTQEEKQDLKLSETIPSTGLYCSQCGECMTQCKNPFDIPTLMRSYMYAYGYKNPAKAKETLEQVASLGIPCMSCNMCSVRCQMGFNIRKKIVNISRLTSLTSS